MHSVLDFIFPEILPAFILISILDLSYIFIQMFIFLMNADQIPLIWLISFDNASIYLKRMGGQRAKTMNRMKTSSGCKKNRATNRKQIGRKINN